MKEVFFWGADPLLGYGIN